MDRKGREVVAAVASVAFRLKKAVAASVAHRGGSGRSPVVIVDVDVVVVMVVVAVVVEVFIKTMRRTASMIQR